MNIALSLEALKTHSGNILDSSGFRLTRISFEQQAEWKIEHGLLAHKSKGYFCVTGIRDSALDKESLILFQPQSALTGILIAIVDSQIFVLLQARVEPGNTGVVQYGPTVQSTPANFLRLHGGGHTRYLDFLYGANKNVLSFCSGNHLDLGKLYYQKTKWLNYALVDNLVEAVGAFVWVPLKVLAEASKEDYLLNTDLRSLLACYDWDMREKSEASSGWKMSDALNYFLIHRNSNQCHDRFVGIDKSESFTITSNEIYTRELDGLEVGMYEVKTRHREVHSWFQPLLGARTRGLGLLLCRAISEGAGYEYLITVKREIGVAGHFSVSPSVLIYPNEDVIPAVSQQGQTLYEFIQSDEGGRFIQHEYLFRVAAVDKNIPIAENQFWVSSIELKRILSLSNVANIQLRNVCSVLIKELNPATFREVGLIP
jgi:dTDP-4-dehydro-6-deoxy-alpha-D-glucopyranose 2,3-dehydratase